MSGIDKGAARVDVVELMAPAARTATFTSAAIDLSLYRRARLVIHAGVCTDGTFTPKLQTSDASGGTYADDDGVINSFTAITTATDETVYEVDIDLHEVDERYGKLVVTATGSPLTGVVASALLVAELKVGPAS